MPGYEAVQWYGVLAPAGTPRPSAIGSTPGQFAAYIKAETEKWARVVKTAGIKPE